MLPGYRLVDLSLPLAESLPCSWPGYVPYRHTLFEWFEERETDAVAIASNGRYHTRWLMFAEHTGTHFDAPTHWIPPPGSGLPGAGPAGATSTHDVPLEQLMGPAAVVDLSRMSAVGEPGVSPRIDVGALESFERDHGAFAAGEVVLLRTDWDSRYVRGPGGSRYVNESVAGREPGWPAPTPEAVELLLDRGVRCLGVDTPSVGAVDDGRPAHVAGLAHGMVYVEGLTRLSELPVRGALFAFLPLPVEKGSGAPGRAVALLPPG
jgi:kynurenine formamidase